MPKIKSGERLITEALMDKACTKQGVYRITEEVFSQFKAILSDLQKNLSEKFKVIDPYVEISYNENGAFEAEIQFSGDILFFSMHTNVFTFEENHAVIKTPYVQQDPLRGYCGMIQIHNFLADSIKYQRPLDIGYLIGRVFINQEKHFFVEGERQLGFLYNDFGNAVINDVYIRAIIESAILYALEFDLVTPPYQEMREISVQQKIQLSGNAAFKTGKRLGFKFEKEK